MDEIISQREFSRRIGVSEATVRKAIEAGYIMEGRTTRPSGLPAINYETALAEWNNSPAGLQAEEKRTVKAPVTKTTTPKPAGAKDTSGQPEDKIMEPGAGGKKIFYDPEIMASKKEILEDKKNSVKIRTQRDALELAKAMGKLVEKSHVESALFEFGKGLRDNLTTIPDRYIDDIRNAPDRHTAHEILLNGINEALRLLASPPDLTRH